MNRRSASFTLLAIGVIGLFSGAVPTDREGMPRIRGDVYALYSGEIYRSHAGDHTFLLSGYTAGGSLEKEVVAEHASAIRAAVTASQKSYGKVSAVAKKNPQVAAALKEIDKHQYAILKICDQLDAEARKEKPDGPETSQACEALMDHIDGADASHDKLLKLMGIPPLDPGVEVKDKLLKQ